MDRRCTSAVWRSGLLVSSGSPTQCLLLPFPTRLAPSTCQAHQTITWNSTNNEFPDNIDYNELKHLIREHTTKGQATAISIPGHPDQALQRFESFFCEQLRDQHDRVDLFVRSKADEFRRRLIDYERKANKMIGNWEDLQETLRGRKGDRLARLETRIMRYVLRPHTSPNSHRLEVDEG